MEYVCHSSLEQSISKSVPRSYHSQVCQGDSTVDLNGLVSSHQLLLFFALSINCRSREPFSGTCLAAYLEGHHLHRLALLPSLLGWTGG